MVCKRAKRVCALGEGCCGGYKMGSSAESFLKERAFNHKMNRAINDESIPTNPDGSLEKSNETLYIRSKQWFKFYKYRDKVPLVYDNTINADGITYGTTDWDKTLLQPVCTFSDLAFSSKKDLFLTMGHEYIHATHFLLRFSNSSLGDFAAFTWEALVSSKAGDLKWASDANIIANENIHWYNRFFNSQYKWKVWEYKPNLGIPLTIPNFNH